jgi:hypothetical protein
MKGVKGEHSFVDFFSTDEDLHDIFDNVQNYSRVLSFLKPTLSNTLYPFYFIGDFTKEENLVFEIESLVDYHNKIIDDFLEDYIFYHMEIDPSNFMFTLKYIYSSYMTTIAQIDHIVKNSTLGEESSSWAETLIGDLNRFVFNLCHFIDSEKALESIENFHQKNNKATFKKPKAKTVWSLFYRYKLLDKLNLIKPINMLDTEQKNKELILSQILGIDLRTSRSLINGKYEKGINISNEKELDDLISDL